LQFEQALLKGNEPVCAGFSGGMGSVTVVRVSRTIPSAATWQTDGGELKTGETIPCCPGNGGDSTGLRIEVLL